MATVLELFTVEVEKISLVVFRAKNAQNFISQERKWVMGHPIHQNRCSFCAELIKNTIRTIKPLLLAIKIKNDFFERRLARSIKKIRNEIFLSNLCNYLLWTSLTHQKGFLIFINNIWDNKSHWNVRKTLFFLRFFVWNG